MIEVKNISMMYGAPPRTVLDNISIDIADGDFVCVLGQTGCGKSTLLRLILGSEHATSGQILVDGKEHKQPDRTRGYVPQKYSLFPDKTVIENITFGAEVSEFGLFGRFQPSFYRRRREFRQRAQSYLRSIGLREADGGKYPDELSGGMQQRVAIAQALMTEPRILLMDEAFSALDPGTRRGMQQLIRELWAATGTTILFVTHNTDEALALATRVVVLGKDGPDSGSRVILDARISEESRTHDKEKLLHQLESVSHNFADEETVLPAA